MLPQNPIALKEWAVVCRALALGRQSLLLRKGGIHEQGGSFQLAHREFWLLPTFEHQRRDALADDAVDLWLPTLADQPPSGTLRIGLYAVVDDEFTLTDATSLAGLAGLQVLSQNIVFDRYHYRVAGLFVLPIRVFALKQPFALDEKPSFAGCRSWVDLETPLSTEGLAPVFDEKTFQQQMRAIRRELKPTGWA